jgi:hypothetical protein
MRKWRLTILEVLVILGIIGVLILLYIPLTAEVDGVGPRHQSGFNLHTMGYACHTYHDKFKALPAGMTLNQHGQRLHGWQTHLLPFLEEQRLYSRIDLQSPWNDPVNVPTMREQVTVYLSQPSAGVEDENGFVLSHYAGNVKILGSEVAWKFKDITDGLSNTLLVGEAAGNFKPWGYPANSRDPALGINKTPDGFGAPWQIKGAKGALFMFADGSTRFLKEDIDPATLKALSTPNGGESVKLEDY